MCVRARTSPTGRSQTTRAASAADGEAERGERVLEQQILLEAIAAAAALHELVLERVEIEPHGHAGERVEILERNRERVMRLQRAQRLERRAARARVTDALQ